MKLLIVTQKVDRNDPILGFFHRWVEEFAKYCEKVVVICLEQGEYIFPSNVRVLSLGKEEGKSRFKYLWRFIKYIQGERKNYDNVFVHMNQEYVLLGVMLWRWWGKKVFLWRNHPHGNWLTRLAVFAAHQIYCTSPQSFTARFAKTRIMPVGIDSGFFFPDPGVIRMPRSILVLGRISPIKRLDILITALIFLEQRGVGFAATILGSALSRTDKEYEQKLRHLAEPLVTTGRLKFFPAVSHQAVLHFYQTHEICVNLTPAGSCDKTIFEAMSCGLLVVVDGRQEVDNLADQILTLLNLSPEERTCQQTINRQLVEKEHDLSQLVKKIVANYV